MDLIKIEDITPDKGALRLLVESHAGEDFFESNRKDIYAELGLIEIHQLDERLLLLKDSGVVVNTNNGNSYVSYLIGLTTVPPNGPLVRKGGSLPD